MDLLALMAPRLVIAVVGGAVHLVSCNMQFSRAQKFGGPPDFEALMKLLLGAPNRDSWSRSTATGSSGPVVVVQ
jgi:hypothetical protein